MKKASEIIDALRAQIGFKETREKHIQLIGKFMEGYDGTWIEDQTLSEIVRYMFEIGEDEEAGVIFQMKSNQELAIGWIESIGDKSPGWYKEEGAPEIAAEITAAAGITKENIEKAFLFLVEGWDFR